MEANIALHASPDLRVVVKDPLDSHEVTWIEFVDNAGGTHLGLFVSTAQIAMLAQELAGYVNTLPHERQPGGADPMKGKRPDFIASVVTDTGTGTARWREIGVGFEAESGTITLLLDALPTSGKVVLTRPKQKDAVEPLRVE
jgi:hypothetical protein